MDHTYRTSQWIQCFSYPFCAISVEWGSFVPQAASSIGVGPCPPAFRRRAAAPQSFRIDGWKDYAGRKCTQAGGRIPQAILGLAASLVLCWLDLSRIQLLVKLDTSLHANAGPPRR